MKITLVRHAETEENFLGKIQGRSNPLLNDTGRRQVLRLKIKLSTLNYDLCFTSPLIRCFETAIVLVGDRTEIIRDDRLIEREMGEMEGRPVEEYNAFQFWDYDKNLKVVTESLSKITKRVEYISYDEGKKEATYVRMPERNELNADINEALIVEFYNK